MKKLYILALLALCAAELGCHRHKAPNPAVQIPDVSDPDRVLYEKAVKDLSKQRFTVARLTLQTLINTYPESEYLQEAKFVLAQSFYNEGTTSSLTQAEAEFKDFITFFPTSDKADAAQYMIAMTHVKQIEQPDRDSTQAQYAQIELKKFIQDYPESPKLSEVKARLRGVDEILAEGIYRVGNEYYVTHNYPAAIDRYREVLQKYPDYSKTADAIYFMGESYWRWNQAPQSAILFTELLIDHPLSLYEKQAKARLTEMQKPIPDPNAVALARAQQMKPAAASGLIGHMWEFMKPRPDVTGDDVPKIMADSENASERANGVQSDSAPKADDPSPGSPGGTLDITPGVVLPGTKPPAKNP